MATSDMVAARAACLAPCWISGGQLSMPRTLRLQAVVTLQVAVMSGEAAAL
jgi:hypothetical protein